MNVLIGIAIVFITAWLLIRQYDMRMVLIAAGLLMAGIALDPLTALDEFARKMVTTSLIQAICPVIGFSFVMHHTRCEAHLITLTAGTIRRAGIWAVPGALLISFAINAALLSAANTAAVAGVILIPLLRAAGIHPALAASTVLAGTFGSMLNPALSINAFVTRIAGKTTTAVVETNTLPVLLALLLACSGLTFMARKKSETAMAPQQTTAPIERPSLIFAAIPLIPLVILLLGASGVVPPFRMGVAQAMMVGALLGVAVTRTSPSEVTRTFFDGMGRAYGKIMGIVIAVGVFVRGMKSIGVIGLWIAWLTTPELARMGGCFGPFLMGIVSGSGDAAAFAFTDAVAPHATQFGMETITMGSMAAISGALGRTLSPLSGAAIICSAIAEVNPVELSKRNTLGLCAAVGLIALIM